MKNTYIFDADGLLIDTMPIYTKSWEKALVLWGAPKTIKINWATMGGKSVSEIARDYINMFNLDITITKILKSLKNITEDHFIKDGVKPMPGVIDFLNHARQKGIKMGVASSGEKEQINRLLSLIDISHYFQVIITYQDVGVGKPDPALFITAAKLLTAEPETCVVFEDAPNGIEAAKRANMFAVAVRGYNPITKNFPKANLTVDSFFDLKNIAL